MLRFVAVRTMGYRFSPFSFSAIFFAYEFHEPVLGISRQSEIEAGQSVCGFPDIQGTVEKDIDVDDQFGYDAVRQKLALALCDRVLPCVLDAV